MLLEQAAAEAKEATPPRVGGTATEWQTYAERLEQQLALAQTDLASARAECRRIETLWRAGSAPLPAVITPPAGRSGSISSSPPTSLTNSQQNSRPASVAGTLPPSLGPVSDADVQGAFAEAASVPLSLSARGSPGNTFRASKSGTKPRLPSETATAVSAPPTLTSAVLLPPQPTSPATAGSASNSQRSSFAISDTPPPTIAVPVAALSLPHAASAEPPSVAPVVDAPLPVSAPIPLSATVPPPAVSFTEAVTGGNASTSPAPVVFHAPPPAPSLPYSDTAAAAATLPVALTPPVSSLPSSAVQAHSSTTTSFASPEASLFRSEIVVPPTAQPTQSLRSSETVPPSTVPLEATTVTKRLSVSASRTSSAESSGAGDNKALKSRIGYFESLRPKKDPAPPLVSKSGKRILLHAIEKPN
jgi:epidermal growth factor receptor substrate 15